MNILKYSQRDYRCIKNNPKSIKKFRYLQKANRSAKGFWVIQLYTEPAKSFVNLAAFWRYRNFFIDFGLFLIHRQSRWLYLKIFTKQIGSLVYILEALNYRKPDTTNVFERAGPLLRGCMRCHGRVVSINMQVSASFKLPECKPTNRFVSWISWNIANEIIDAWKITRSR